jgi:NAD(P)H-flavin reductase
MRALAEPAGQAGRPGRETVVTGTGGWAAPQPWRVVATQTEAPGVVTLELDPPAGAGFVFRPGQFNMLYAPGVGEVPISISGDPASPAPVTHTIRDVGPVTHALCSVEAGAEVGVRGPYGTSWPLAEAKGGDLVIIAGGIGLPPLRPAWYEALAHRDAYGRLVLLYGARTPADLMFPAELATWRGRFDIQVEVTVDAAGAGWRGDVGVVPALVGSARCDPAATTAFVVGPEIMMRFTVRALLAAGVPAGRVFVSLERNMQCATAMCGHCQLGPFLVCRDGPVLSYAKVAPWLNIKEL